MCMHVCMCVCVCAVRAHKQQRTKHKLTVFIVSLPALSRRRRRRRCLCIFICFAPLPNADVIAIQSCHCTQRASLCLAIPASISFPLSFPISFAHPLTVFLHSPGERFGPLLHIFARALKACNVFLTPHVLPLPLLLPWQRFACAASIFPFVLAHFVVAACWFSFQVIFQLFILNLIASPHERKAVHSPQPAVALQWPMMTVIRCHPIW